MIRVYVAFIAAAQQLYERYGSLADPWMTLAGYFNSMRELGGTRRLVEDDIKSRLRNIPKHGLPRRSLRSVEELTSRVSSAQIPVLLDRLELRFDPEDDRRREEMRKEKKTYNGPTPVDVVLATNMISVGVDVQRLGLMVVSGQPKNTAEYIQATSRVGRSFPGLVCTVYNWARPRDLSHYETFEHYHATFYQHVEALSVTPFAARALDRGLTALLVSLVRLGEKTFNADGAAQQMTSGHPLVIGAVETIVERARRVGGPEKADLVRKMLQQRLLQWTRKIQGLQGGAELHYKGRRTGLAVPLLDRTGKGQWTDLTVLNSMREVEPSVGLILLDKGPGDAPGDVESELEAPQ